MFHSLWKKLCLTAALLVLPCGAWAMPAPGAAIHVPKPGMIGSHMPRPTVPIGNYQHPGKIPTPMARPAVPPRTVQPIRPIPVPKVRTQVTAPSYHQAGHLPQNIGLSRQAQLFVYRPALHLYSWRMPSLVVGPLGFQGLAHNPQLSAAWWKPLPLWNQGDIMNSILPRLTEEVH